MRTTLSKSAGGYLNKKWYEDENGLYLVKGCDNNCYEAQTEVIASTLATLLNLEAVPYYLDSSHNFPTLKSYKHNPYVSICYHYNEDVNSISFYEYISIMFPKRMRTWDIIKRVIVQNPEQLFLMFQFDAIIGNSDRHLNNWEITNVNNMLWYSPMFDFGAGLLSQFTDDEIRESYEGKLGPDLSKPFIKTHKKQMQTIKRYYGEYLIKKEDVDIGCILNELYERCKTTFDTLSIKRQKAILSYLKVRMEEYLC